MHRKRGELVPIGEALGGLDGPVKGRLSKEEEKEVKKASCRQDAACWGKRHLYKASLECEAGVESLALYDHQWTDSWLEDKFDKAAWHDQKSGVVIYFGDKVKFQNAFGAWKHTSYKCGYDTKAGKVLDVQVFEK